MNKVEEFVLMVQKAVCKVKADVENEFHKSKYADLEGVLDVLNPFLAEHSVLSTQFTRLNQKQEWVLVTELKIDKEAKEYEFPLLGFDSKTPMQSLGSAVTYARRYSYKGIFKLVDSDDDANAVTPTGEPSKPARKSEVEKMLRAFAALNASKSDVEAMVQQDVEDMTSADMDSLLKIYKQVKEGKKKVADFVPKDKQWQE